MVKVQRLSDRERKLKNYLLSLVSNRRQERLQQVLLQRTYHLAVVLEEIYDPQNASAVLRTADAFGLQSVYTIENRHPFSLRYKVAAGTEKWLDVHRFQAREQENEEATAVRCREHLRDLGYRIVATSSRTGAMALNELPVENPLAIFFGSEHLGLSKQTLEDCDYHIKIPMRGFAESFNISASAAMALYDLRTRLEQSGINFSLSPDEQEKILYKWLFRSVRRAETIAANFERDAVS